MDYCRVVLYNTAGKEDSMKAAWDWHFQRQTDAERDVLIEFVAEMGFDTLVLNTPTPYLVESAHGRGIKVVSVISPSPNPRFLSEHPECVQRMRPYEDGIQRALDTTDRESAGRIAHRWFPYLQGGDLFCYAHDASVSRLKDRAGLLLETADGIALDGFGFKNHYGCFCERCVERHGGESPEHIAEVSKTDLIEISRVLRDFAKDQKRDAIVMNHVWPPFDPDPYYGAQLYLDYCTQTISWFYRPFWPLERVEFEAAEHKRLEIPGRNMFVPFIGMYNDPYGRRSVQRIHQEIDIALQYGGGSLVICTLEAPKKDEAVRKVISEALRKV